MCDINQPTDRPEATEIDAPPHFKSMKELIYFMDTLPRPQYTELVYRRAYRDGWVEALLTIHELMFREDLKRRAAYDACWRHWEGALAEWLHSDPKKPGVPPRM
jgi:hypothetical protein